MSLIPPRQTLSLAEKVVRAFVLIAALGAVCAVAYLLRFLVVPIVVGMLLSYVLGPLADRLENAGLKRSTAVTVCFGLLFGVVGLVVAGVAPSIEVWLREAPKPGEQSAFELQLSSRIEGWKAVLLTQYPGVKWTAVFAKVSDVLQHQRETLVEKLPALAMSVASQAGSVALGLVVAFFVMVDGSSMKRAVVSLVPNRHFENTLVMLHRVDRQISSYLLGTAIENILVAILVAIPLALLGMPNAILFAVIFGLCNVVPFVGPFIGASAGLLFSLLVPDAPSMLALVIVYVVVHLIDAMVISPMVMGKSLDLHPLTVILGIAVGGGLGGVAGMLVIIPLIAVTKAIATTIADGVRNAQAA